MTLKDKKSDDPFRIVIAVHRPRFRGRMVRAAEITGWDVTTLLNMQDPVGLCAKAPRPPDILVISADFGRQKTMAIFRAVQPYRSQGMRIVGLVEDCEQAPEGLPDSIPSRLCDVCLTPPYLTMELRKTLTDIYSEIRHKPAPPPTKMSHSTFEEDED